MEGARKETRKGPLEKVAGNGPSPWSEGRHLCGRSGGGRAIDRARACGKAVLGREGKACC